MTAETLMLAGGVLAFAVTFAWVRSRRLREKYAVLWMSVATLLLLLGVFPEVVKDLARMTRMAYPSMVLFLSLGMIYLFSMSVSLSLTRARRCSIRLLQELALARHELETLHHRLSALEEQRPADTQTG